MHRDTTKQQQNRKHQQSHGSNTGGRSRHQSSPEPATTDYQG
jgi:hypothetical protein